MRTLPAPRLDHVCDLEVLVAAPLSIGDTGLGERRIVAIEGGSVRGPGLSGRIRPGGADTQIIRSGGATELAARYVVETEDGALVYVENIGLRSGSAEAMERIRLGLAVDPALVYFRTSPRFETAAPALRWLMTRLMIGVGERAPDRVLLSIYAVG
jgi:hypothetical protein